MLVQGIGEKTFELIKPYVAISGETTLEEKVKGSRSGSSASSKSGGKSDGKPAPNPPPSRTSRSRPAEERRAGSGLWSSAPPGPLSEAVP